jgi:hypothetical protein
MRAAACTTVLVAICASLITFTADEVPRGLGGGKDRPGKGSDAPVTDLASLFRTDVPARPLDVVLGRPTNDSVAASVLAYSDCEGMIQCGLEVGSPGV